MVSELNPITFTVHDAKGDNTFDIISFPDCPYQFAGKYNPMELFIETSEPIELSNLPPVLQHDRYRYSEFTKLVKYEQNIEDRHLYMLLADKREEAWRYFLLS